MVVKRKDIEFQVLTGQVDEDSSFWNRINNNIWEEHTFNYLDKFLSKDKNFLDIGSWIGPISIYSSFKCKKCFSFEPDPIAFSALTKNIGLNKIDNIELFNIAIGDENKKIPLGIRNKRGDSMSSILSDKNPDGVIVEMRRMTEIVTNLTDISVVKIDIEGFECVIIDEIIKSLQILNLPVLILSLHKEFFRNPDADITILLSKLSELYKNENGLDLNIDEIKKYNFIDLCLIRK